MSLKGKEHGTLGNMYSDYFLDYASYVIMERAVPHLGDGLKPVQRRILHSMRQMEDGRYNKVANIVGDTMKYHPHGNTAIEDALVGMGQKGLLIDTQGNWGNVLTGDPSAAGRYIEARLTPFALEVAFNPVLGFTRISFIPGGRLKGMSGLFLRTSFIKFLNIGAATELPVSLNPSGLGLSKPTNTPTTKSLENPMNHASVFELVVPVLPAKFLLRDLITTPVPLSTAPFSMDAI